jgi:hypothetical protein
LNTGTTFLEERLAAIVAAEVMDLAIKILILLLAKVSS